MSPTHVFSPNGFAALYGHRAHRPLEQLHAAHALAMQARWNQTRNDEVTPQSTHPLQMERLAAAPWHVQLVKLADVVASVQEGPAHCWTDAKKAIYLRQRTELVREVLSPACGRLRVSFERAVCQPVWGGVA